MAHTSGIGLDPIIREKAVARTRELGQHTEEHDSEASPEMHEDIYHHAASGHSLSTGIRGYLRRSQPY